MVSIYFILFDMHVQLSNLLFLHLELLSKIYSQKMLTDENIPSEFLLTNLFRQDGLSNLSFLKCKERGYNGIHFSPFHPDKLATFDRSVFEELYKNILQDLGDDELWTINNLNGKKCILSDRLVWRVHNFKDDQGGAVVPHILDPTSEVW